MRIDIVIPAWNEERRIDRTLERYRRVLVDPGIRFLVALDRCSDGTAAIVARHREADDRVHAVYYPKLGKGGVIMETFRRCDADYIGFVDADCATPPTEFARLVATAEHADGAIASRRHPAAVVPVRRSAGRRVASAGFAAGTRAMFHLPYSDTQCGAKVLRRDAVQRITPLLSSRDFLFDVDLLLVARDIGLRIVEVPTVWIDRDGSRLQAARDTRRMGLSLLRLWMHRRVLPLADPLPLDPDQASTLTEVRDIVLDPVRDTSRASS